MTLFAQFSAFGVSPWVVYGTVFLAIAAAAWLAIEYFLGNRSRAEERLEDFRDPAGRKRRDDKAGSSISRLIESAAPAIAKFQPKNEQETSRLKLELSYAGFRSESAPAMYLMLRVVGGVAGLFLGAGISIFTGGANIGAIIKTAIIAGVLFYLPTIIVMWMAKKRKEQIFLGLPDALDLMVVCVEAGLGLDQAMRKVSEEMRKSFRVIAEEFGICNLQLQMGRGRTQVLQELGTRSGVDELRALASILIQADKFGSSIAQALRVQSDSMRTRRKQIAEEKAAKTAVKLIFPLVLFIFPGIFVVLVGPAAITMVREMLPVMGGGR
ncbi:MAG TPA: type II secretion system F family protein [Pirellulaceae bacterium]|nr:type II secretion system F family protein [Pirellulaceae bacterium]